MFTFDVPIHNCSRLLDVVARKFWWKGTNNSTYLWHGEIEILTTKGWGIGVLDIQNFNKALLARMALDDCERSRKFAHLSIKK